MTDETPKAPTVATVQIIPIQDDFPGSNFATVYVDGITSLVPGPQVVKLYMGRLEPSLKAEAKSRTTPVIQLIMPTDGFLQTAAFFEVLVQRMKREKTVTDEQLAAAKKFAGGG